MTLTASKLELAMRCEGHLTLPQINEPNEWSDAGSASHAEDEAAINAGDIPPQYAERWPGLTWRAEVSYAYDASDGEARYLGMGLRRNYGPMGPFEIPGTIDIEGRGDGILVVGDKKSFEAVTPAKDNLQVRFLALAAARVHQPNEIFVAIDHQLTGFDVAELDPFFDLDAIAESTRRLFTDSIVAVSRARRGLPVQFNTGRWCRWCNAFNDCPKQKELKVLVALPIDEPELAIKTYVDEDSAPLVYELYRRVGILQKRLAQQIHAYVANRPIPIGEGRMYGMRNKLGNAKLDGNIVWQILKDMHGQAIADAAVDRTATKVRLTKALKGIRGGLKSALKAVEDAGGLKRGSKIVFEEYDVGPRLIEEDRDEEEEDE